MPITSIEQLPKATPLGGHGGGTGDMSWWAKVPPRAPLPPFPKASSTQNAAVWAEVDNYQKTLAHEIPKQPDVDFYRARFNGIVCKAIPPSRWNYPNNPYKAMTWDLPWYSLKDQNTYLDIYQYEYGLTHLMITMPFAHNPNGQGTDIGCFDHRFVDCAANAARRGMFVVVTLHGAPGELTREQVGGMWHKLIDARAIHRAVVCWQADMSWDPLPLFDELCWAKLFALKNCPDVRIDMHWWRDACAWWDAKPKVDGVPDDLSPRVPNDTYTKYGIEDRRTYYEATGYPEWRSRNGQSYIDRICANLGEEYRVLNNRAILDATLMQVDVNAPIDNLQDQVLSIWKDGVGIPAGRTRLVASEYEAQGESDNDTFPPRDPWCGDMKGYLQLCMTKDGQTVAGYTDGGLWPDGRIL